MYSAFLYWFVYCLFFCIQLSLSFFFFFVHIYQPLPPGGNPLTHRVVLKHFCLFLWISFTPLCKRLWNYDFHKTPIMYLSRSNETQTWCNTVQVLFLQCHSTCFGRKRPSSGIFKTSTAATGTCVIVVGKLSHLLIRAVPLCRFYFCRVTLHVSGASAHHQEYLKLVQRPLVHVFCKNI